ncbi:MAG: alpha/beta fold hydrolase, partial [Opitutaceae bacterium]
EEVVGRKHFAPIFGVDADGKNPKVLIDGPDLVGTVLSPSGVSLDRPRFSTVAGFPPGDRNHLLVQAVGAEFAMSVPETPGSARTGGKFLPPLPIPVILPTTLFSVDVSTGKKTSLGDEFIVGPVGYDRQGRSRISYAKQRLVLDRPFALLGRTPLKFNESWLGSLAGHFTITPKNYFNERAYPLGFDVDPDILYVASNVGRDTFGIYALNLKTKQRTALALENPHLDLAPLEPTYPAPQLIFDEHRGQLAGVRSPGPQPVSVWSDAELAASQQAVEQKFPQRAVEILEWSDTRDAFLIRVSGGTEPGRYFVWRKAENLPLEIFRSAPWLKAADLHPTEFFEFETPEGVHLSGYLTTPRTPRLSPPPAVMCFANGFPATAHAEFDREAQVLASMGLVVIRLNHRGVQGFGRSHREGILPAIDRIPVDDAISALNWIATRHPIDRKRIATLGSGFGGYLAVRAVQLHPETFRCAVSFNAPLDPGAWVRPEVTTDEGIPVNFPQAVNRAFLQRGLTNLAALSVFDRPSTSPVFLVVDPTGDAAIDAANQRLRRKLGADADYVEVNGDFAAELPAARARVYTRLDEFFNLNLYNYRVRIGESKEVK